MIKSADSCSQLKCPLSREMSGDKSLSETSHVRSLLGGPGHIAVNTGGKLVMYNINITIKTCIDRVIKYMHCVSSHKLFKQEGGACFCK